MVMNVTRTTKMVHKCEGIADSIISWDPTWSEGLFYIYLSTD